MSPATARMEIAGKRYGDTALVLLVLLIVWQIIHMIVGSIALAAPLATLKNVGAMLADKDFWPNVLATGRPFLISLIIEVAAGISLGLLLGLHRLSREVVEPIVVGLYSVPKIIFYPVILLLFGIGVASEVVFAVLHGILPIILFTMTAVRRIKPVYLKTARSLRLTRTQTALRVALPAVIPDVFSGIRIGFAVTLLGVLLCEMFGSKNGLGFLLMQAIGLNKVETIASLALIMAAFAVMTNAALLAIDRRLHRN